jgi:hypothetical protein
MIDPELVRDTGPIDTILAHFDLDGLYAAAKWLLGGREPYPGADDDARAVDTRIGEIGAEAERIDKALRAHYRDEALKQRIIRYLITGLPPGGDRDAIVTAASDYDRTALGAREIAERYRVEHDVAIVEIPSGAGEFDKTELLLLGQERAKVAVVVDGANVSIAAPFDSGLDFVALLELGGGMPTRVNIPNKRLADALGKIKRALGHVR